MASLSARRSSCNPAAASLPESPISAPPMSPSTRLDLLEQAFWSVTEAAGSFVLSDTAPIIANNYSTWATANGISGEPAAGDFDYDGLTNLVEYSLGLNPTTSSPPPGSFDGSRISYTLPSGQPREFARLKITRIP